MRTRHKFYKVAEHRTSCMVFGSEALYGATRFGEK